MMDEAKSWLPVSDLEAGFNENKLSATDKLSGKELNLYFENGQIIKYSFQDTTHLTWKAMKAPDAEIVLRDEYEAIEVAPDLYFVDFVKKRTPLIGNFDAGHEKTKVPGSDIYNADKERSEYQFFEKDKTRAEPEPHKG